MKPQAALIILYDSEKRFLLQHRTKDAERLPDYWAFFGGGIEKGESPEEAIRREAFEELNYKLKFPQLAVEKNFELDCIPGYMYVYIEEFNEVKSTLRLQEGQGWGWFKAEETDELKMTDNDRDVVKSIAHYLKNTTNGYAINQK